MNRNQSTCTFSGCLQKRWIGSTKCYVHSGGQDYSQWMKNLVSDKQLSSTATTGAPLPGPERSPWVNIPGTPQNSFRGYATRPGNSSTTDPQAALRQEDRTASCLKHSYLNSYPRLSGLIGGPGLPVTQPLTDPAGRQSSVSGAVGLPEHTQSQRQPQTTGQPGINLPAGTRQSNQYGVNQQSGQYDLNQGTGQYDVDQGTGQYDVNRGIGQYGVNYGNTQPALNRPSCDYGVNPHTWHPTLNQPTRQPGWAQGGTHPGMNGPTMTVQQRSEETIGNHLTRQSGINQAGMFYLPHLQHGMSQPLRMAQPTGQPSVGQPLSQQFMAESAWRAVWNLPTSQAGICQPTRQTGMILPTRLAGENRPEGQSGRSLPTLLPGTSELISQSGPSQPVRLPGMNQPASQAVTSGSTGHDGPPDPRTQSSVQHDQPTAVSDTFLQSVTGTSSVQHDQPTAVSDTFLQSVTGTSSVQHDQPTAVSDSDTFLQSVTGTSSVQHDRPAAISDTSLQSLTGTSSVQHDRPAAISDTSLQSLTGTSSVQHDRPAAIFDTSLQSLRTPPSDGLGDSVTSIGLSQGVASSADQNSRSSHAPCVTETHSVERSGPTTTSKQLEHQQTVNPASDDSLSTILSQSLEQGARHQHTVTGARDCDFLSTPFSRSQEPVPDPPRRQEVADVDDIIFVASENLPEQAMKQESDANEDAVIFMGSENLPIFSLPEQIMQEETDVNEDDDILFQGVERRPRVNGAAKKKEVAYVLLSREEALDSELEEMQEDSSAPATGPSSDATSSLNKVDSAHTVASEQQEPDTGVASSPDKQQSQPSAHVNEDDDILFQGVERRPRVNGAAKKMEVAYVLLSREEALDSELEEMQEDSSAPATGPSSDATSSLNKVDSAHTVASEQQEPDTGVASSPDKQQSQPSAHVNEDDDILFQGVERRPRVNGAAKKKEVAYVLLSREEALDSELEEMQEDSSAPVTGPSSDATSSLNKVDSAHTVASEQQEPDTGVASSPDKQQSQPSAHVHPIASSPDKQQSQPSAHVHPIASGPDKQQSQPSAKDGSVTLDNAEIDSDDDFIILEDFSDDDEAIQEDASHTVSLSGQSCNWSTQPARAKPMNALSTEAYYRCGGFDGRCSFHTLIPTKLKLHLREVHPRDEKYPCVHCGSQELGHDDLLQHLEGHLGLQSLALYCSHLDCDFSSFSPEEVITHMGVCHVDYHNHICWRCCTKFGTLREFSAHVKGNLVTIIKCPHCSAKDVNRKSVLSHIVTSHPDHGRMVGIQKALVCQERKLNNWSGQIESGGADRDQGPPVLERIEPLPSSQGLPQGVVSAEHSSMLSSSQRDGDLSSVSGVPDASTERKVCVIAPMTEVKAEIVGTRPETVGTEQPMEASTTQGEEEPAEGRQSPHCDAEAWINLTYSQQNLDDSVDALEILCRFCDHGSRTVADHVQHIHAFHPERFKGFACRVCDFVSADPELRSAHKCRRLRSRAAAGLTGEDPSPRGNKKTATVIASDRSPKLPSSSARMRVYVRSERSWVDGALRSTSSGLDGAERTPHVKPSSFGVDGAETSTTKQCNAGEIFARSSSPATPMTRSSATGPREMSLPQRTVELDSPGLKSTLAKARARFNVSGLASGCTVDDDGSRSKRTTAGLHSKSNMAIVKEAKKQMLYCKLCRFSRRNVEKMCKHVYRAHKSVMKCPLCSVYPAGDNTFYRHLSDKHAEEKDAILSQVSAFNWITELAAEAGESDCDKTKAEKAQLVSSKNCKALVSGDGIKPGSANCDKGKPSKKQTKLASSKSKHYKGKPSQKGTKIASSKLCKEKALTTKMKPVPSKKKSRSLESAVYSCKLCSHSGRSLTWMRVHVYLQHKEVMKCPRCNAYPTNDRGLYHHLSVRHPAHKDALYKQHRSLAWLMSVYPSAHDTGHKAKTSTSASQKRKHDSCENVSGEGETLAQSAAKKFKASATSQSATAKKIKASKTSAESAAMKLKAPPTQTTSKNVKPSPAQTSTPKRKASEISQQSAAKKLKTSTQKPGAEANKGFKCGIIHCKLCSKVCRSQDKMYLHLFARHPEVQCSACSTQVSTASELKKHLKEKHPEQVKALYEQSKPANWLRFPDDLKSSKEKGRWVLSKKVQNPMRMRIRKAWTASTVSKLSDIDKGCGSFEAPTSAFDAVSVTNQEGTCLAQDSNPQEADVFPSKSNSPELDSYNTENVPTHGSELDSYNTEVYPSHGSELDSNTNFFLSFTDSNTNNRAGPTERCSNNAQLASDSMPSEIGQFSSDSVAMDTAASDEQYSGDANIAFDLHPSERGIFLSDGTTMDKVEPEKQCTNNAPCALGSNLSEVAALSSDSEAMDTVTPKEPESNSQQLQSSAIRIPSSAGGDAKDAVVSTPSADGVVVKLETRVPKEEMEYRCPHCTSNHKMKHRFYEHLCYHYHHRCYQCAHCSFQAFSESAVVNHSKKTHSQAPEVHHHIKQRMENRIHLVSEKAHVPVSDPYTEKRLLALERAKQKKLLKQSERQQQKAQKLLNKVPKKGKSSPGKISLKKTKKPDASLSSKKKKNSSEISRSGERKWLMCPYCRGERKTQTAIEGEIRYHIHYKPFCCPYCEVTTGSEKSVKNHIPKAHPGEPVTVRFEGIERKEERLKELLARAVALSQSTVKVEVSGNVKMKYSKGRDSGNVKMKYRKGGDSGNVKMKYRKDGDSGNVKMKYRKGGDSGNVKMKYRKDGDSGNVKMKYRKGGDSGNVKMKYQKGVDSGGKSDVHRCTHCDSFWFRGNKRAKVIIREKMAQHVRTMHRVCCSRCPFRTTDREALSSHVLASHPTVNAEDAHQSSDNSETRRTSYPEDAQQSSDNASNIFPSSSTSVDARLILTIKSTRNTDAMYSETETGNTAARYSESETGNTAARYSETRTGNTATRYSETETGNIATRYSEFETNPSTSNSEAGARATLSHDTGAKVASFSPDEIMPANFLFEDPPAHSSSDPERVVDEACGSPQHWNDAFNADVPTSVDADGLLFCEELPPDHPQSSNR